MVVKPSEPLYHAVALGMTAYSRLAFNVEVLRGDRAGLPRGALLVSTHRAETDAQLFIYAIYWYAGIWRDRANRITFAARQDLFAPGFFAGFPPALPTLVRRLLFPVRIARYLPLVRVHPIRSARSIQVGQALQMLPGETPLEDVLAPDVLAGLRARAPVRTARDALRGDLADLLWRPVGPDELASEAVWAQWAAAAKEDVRKLVDVLHAGDPLLVFPEGRPSPDGTIGPLRRGVELLVRRGRPEQIRPFGIAYDPFVRGRTRAFLSFGEPFPTPQDGVEEAVLASLRIATPLTTASLVAHRLLGGARTTDELASALREAIHAAHAEGRSVEKGLEERPLARLSECLSALRRRGVLETPDGRSLVLLRGDPLVRFAREYESARA